MDRIAVVGLSCRFPGAPNPDAFWTLLEQGCSAAREVPADRWDIEALYDADPAAPGRLYARHGAFLDRIDAFDAAAFDVSPREAASMDPLHRLLLELAWEALERAGHAPDALKGRRVGVFLGLAQSDYSRMLAGCGLVAIDGHWGTGLSFSGAAGRISHVFGFTGPSLAVDTACSSALVAVHQARRALQLGECDWALAGAASLIVTPDVSVSFCKARMLSPTGRSAAFDAAADGYLRGEGGGMLLLRRLGDAEADGDRIEAVLTGSAVNQDGGGGGLTVPQRRSQAAVIRAALDDARLAPADIGYLECHGTGTPVGDPVEVRAAAEVLAAGRDPSAPLPIGSVKTNIGHLEAASGMAGLVKAILALRHGTLPAHLHFTTPNPRIPWARLAVEVVTGTRPWPASSPRRAGVSSFGFSGTNAHVIVEPGHLTEVAPAPTTPLLLVLAAKSAEALPAMAAALRPTLACSDAGALCAAAARTAGAFRHRAAVVATDRAALLAGLDALAECRPAAGLIQGLAATPGRTVWLFTGQGSQHPGMSRALHDRFPRFRDMLDRCRAALPEVDLDSLLLAGHGDIDATANAQPALVAHALALAELWRGHVPGPAVVLGHSVGQIAATIVAGALSVEDGLRLAARRGALMGALPAGGAMLAVPAPVADVLPLIDGHEVELAADNGTHVVLAGPCAELDRLSARLAAQGLACRVLRTSHAFHSRLLEPCLDAFAAAAEEIEHRPLALPMVDGLTGAILPVGTRLDAAYWRRHAWLPVRFADGMRSLAGAGCTTFVEIGPDTVLASLVRALLPDTVVVASAARQRPGDLAFAEALAGLHVAGADVDVARFTGAPAARGGLARLPTYPFQRRRHWIDVPDRRASVPDMGNPADPGQAEAPADTDVVVREVVARALRMRADEVPADRTLRELGIDSILGMEILAHLAGRTGVVLPAAMLGPDVTVAGLAEALAARRDTEAVDDTARMIADAQLDADIRPQGQPRQGSPDCVLLTGASGFLGKALLAELLATTGARVLCLQRGPAGQMLDGLTPAEAARVEIVQGDLELRHFGLDATAWASLAARADTVIHAAARVNWLATYADLAPVNVAGTREVLRFACTGRPKPLHVISTLGVFPGGLGDASRVAFEASLPALQADRYETAYARTKAVAERLCAEARERGLPVSVYRMDFLTAAAGPTPWRYIVPRALASAVELGCLPDFAGLLDLLPVDAVAKAVVALARAGDGPGTWHLLNRRPLRIAELQALLVRLGYAVRLVGWTEWLAAVERRDDGALAPFAAFLRSVTPLLDGYAGFLVDDTETRAALARACPDWLDRLDDPLAIATRIVGDLVRERRIPPPGWSCHAVLADASLHDAVLAEAPDAVVGPGGAVGWTRPALDGDGALLPAAEWPVSAGPRRSARCSLRGVAFQRLVRLAEHAGCGAARLLETAAVVAWWRASRSPSLEATSLAVARVEGASPLLGRGPLALREVELAAQVGFGALAASLDAAVATTRAPELAIVCRKGPLAKAWTQPVTLSGGPAGAVADLAVATDAATIDWHVADATDAVPPEALAEAVGSLLQALAERPLATLAELPLTRAVETDLAVAALPMPPRAASSATVLDRIMARAAARPHATALETPTERVTYADLLDRAGRIAAGLTAAGAASGTPVAVCLERTADLVASLLAVLWVGSPYVPLDPGHPERHRRQLVAAAGATLVLSDAPTAFPGVPAQVLTPDDAVALAVRVAPPAPRAGRLAYLIFTSGSTGEPKGVEIRQDALVGLLDGMIGLLDLGQRDTWLAVTTPAFDIAVLELLGPLVAGARVWLAPRGAAGDGTVLAGLLDRAHATVMQATPSGWSLLLDSGWNGRRSLLALSGGEALGPTLAGRLVERCAAVWNLYGPTEATVWATAQRVDRALVEACRTQASLPIGEALPGMAALVLDDSLHPVPNGVAGELHLAGSGLARGYRSDPDRTRTAFPQLRLGGTRSARVYRTGDLVRREAGGLVFLRRRDLQLKHRGHRIEPAEIERHIEAFPGIGRAAVAAVEGATGTPVLAAYVTGTDGTPDSAALRAWLAGRLPAYMVPEAIQVLRQLPLGPTGKLDRRALPGLAVPAAAGGAPPRTATERRLLAAWRQLLRNESIGIHDSFFDLRGHSLAAAALFARIAEVFGCTLPVRTLAGAATVAELAAVIDRTLAGSTALFDPDLAPIRRDAELPSSVRPADGTVRHPPAEILVTGATGFLGAEVVAELCRSTDARLHCLVRADTPAAARVRLLAALAEAGDWETAWNARVVACRGDLEAPGIGLDTAVRARLAATVDAVVHVGARVDLALPYDRLKDANVAATVDLLAFCGEGRAKAFHHVSTTSVFDQPRHYDGRQFDETAAPELSEMPLTGYAASKWAAERLVDQARAPGLAGSVLRPGFIAGHGQTGRWSSSDLVPAAIRGCLELGALPTVRVALLLTPVDFVARAVTAAVVAGPAAPPVLHPLARRATPLGEIGEWLERLGYRLERLPLPAWQGRLRAALDRGRVQVLAPHAPALLEPLPQAGGTTALELMADGRRPRFGREALDRLLPPAELASAELDEPAFRRAVRRWRDEGFLPAPDEVAALRA